MYSFGLPPFVRNTASVSYSSLTQRCASTGDAMENAALLREVLSEGSHRGAKRDSVVLNAGQYSILHITP